MQPAALQPGDPEQTGPRAWRVKAPGFSGKLFFIGPFTSLNPITEFEMVVKAGGGGADAAAAGASSNGGVGGRALCTLVHFSAQREQLLWDELGSLGGFSGKTPAQTGYLRLS